MLKNDHGQSILQGFMFEWGIAKNVQKQVLFGTSLAQCQYTMIQIFQS